MGECAIEIEAINEKDPSCGSGCSFLLGSVDVRGVGAACRSQTAFKPGPVAGTMMANHTGRAAPGKPWRACGSRSARWPGTIPSSLHGGGGMSCPWQPGYFPALPRRWRIWPGAVLVVAGAAAAE